MPSRKIARLFEAVACGPNPLQNIYSYFKDKLGGTDILKLRNQDEWSSGS